MPKEYALNLADDAKPANDLAQGENRLSDLIGNRCGRIGWVVGVGERSGGVMLGLHGGQTRPRIFPRLQMIFRPGNGRGGSIQFRG